MFLDLLRTAQWKERQTKRLIETLCYGETRKDQAPYVDKFYTWILKERGKIYGTLNTLKLKQWPLIRIYSAESEA